MKDITDDIDTDIQSNLVDDGIDFANSKFWGLAELIEKGKQVQPVTVDLLGNPVRAQIAIDDKFDGIVYHRVLNSASIDSPESFGANIAIQFNVRLRTVLAYKVSKFAEEFVFDFINALPQRLTVTGYDYINIAENISLVVDQKGIYEQEFGGGEYEKHMIPWNIFAIEHDVQFVKC